MFKFIKLKARYLFLMFLGMLVLDVLVVIYTFKSTNKTINMILLIASFLITGLFFDLFIDKLFSKNALKKLYKEKIYLADIDNIKSKLSDFYKREYSYGAVYSKVEDRCLYKISIISDIKEYRSFDEASNKNSDSTPGINKANKMIGIEIFLEYDDKLIESIRDFSISSEKIYYQTFYLKDDKLINANYLEPYTMHTDSYNKLLKDLGIRDEEDTNL